MLFIKAVIIGLLSYVATLFLPWYSPFIICFLVGLILSNKSGNNFLSGLLGVGIFWLSYALFLDFSNQHQLSTKIAGLFSESLKTDITSGVLIMVTTFLGALLGGLTCMAGAMITNDSNRRRMNKALKNKKYSLKMK